MKSIYTFHQQLICSTRGEVESMIKFQHEIDVDFREEIIRVRLVSTMRARISPTVTLESMCQTRIFFTVR